MEKSPQLQEEKGLERRAWLGCVLEFGLASILLALITALSRFRLPVEPAPPAWLVLVSSLAPFVAMLVVGIGGVVLIGRLMSWSGEAERRRHQRSTAVLREALPGLGLSQETPKVADVLSGWELPKLILLILLRLFLAAFAALAVIAILDRALPGLPLIVSSALAVAVCLGAFFLVGRAIGRSQSSPSAAAEPPAKSPAAEWTRPERTRQVAGILYFVLMGVPLFGAMLLMFRIPAPGLVMPALVMGVCGVLYMAIDRAYLIAPFLWIEETVKRGEYDNAIRRVRLVENLSIHPGFFLNLHGVILLWAGRYEEARKTFEESIGEQRKELAVPGISALGNIGYVLALQGNYDEAIKKLEGSTAMSPQQVMVYSDLAEALLYQGVELPRALELAERAWKNQQTSRLARWLSPHQGGQILANRAWALARLGRYQEAEETLARAFAVADRSFKPVLAGIYLRAGYVALARADDGRAKEYFRQGQQLDPNGHYGRRCQQAMQGSGLSVICDCLKPAY